MDFAQLEDHFVNCGGQFLISSFNLHEKVKDVKAYLFDWDGVFNNGVAISPESGSGYSAVDAAGVFLLKLGHHLSHQERPRMGIITGEMNPQAQAFAERLSFDAAYVHTRNKTEALQHFAKAQQLKEEEICYVYDDVLDLGVAERVGVRLAVGRLANPMLMDYITHHQLADYISACQGQEHAVREFCELLLALQGQHFKAIEERLKQGATYQTMLEEAQKVKTLKYQYINANFVKI